MEIEMNQIEMNLIEMNKLYSIISSHYRENKLFTLATIHLNTLSQVDHDSSEVNAHNYLPISLSLYVQSYTGLESSLPEPIINHRETGESYASWSNINAFVERDGRWSVFRNSSWWEWNEDNTMAIQNDCIDFVEDPKPYPEKHPILFIIDLLKRVAPQV